MKSLLPGCHNVFFIINFLVYKIVNSLLKTVDNFVEKIKNPFNTDLFSTFILGKT